MNIFFKILAAAMALLMLTACLSGCEDKRNTNPTIDAPDTEPSTGGDFIKPPVYTVAIDHEALPISLKAQIGKAELDLYKKIVKTYLDFGNSVPFEAGVKYGAVIKLIEAYFPVIYSDTDGAKVNVENNTVGWTYKVETKADHDKAVKAFTDKATEYLTGLRFDDSDTEVAMVIYEKLYKTIEYDELTLPAEEPEKPAEGENAEEKEPEPVYPKSLYTPIVHKKGNAEMLSKAYCYLLTQAGIDALDLLCTFEGETGPQNFDFLAVKLEDKWYYSDPAEGVRYDSFTRFAFSDTELSGMGLTAPANALWKAFSAVGLETVIVCDSNRFFDLTSGANKVELNTAKDSMLFEPYIGTKWNFTRLHG
ncbi:MAG: hypothetical protein IJW27_02970 [Clostridia bacterium]|nr:hypothetical protein [Clostridia bacterium]